MTTAMLWGKMTTAKERRLNYPRRLISGGVFIQGFKTLDEAKQFRKEHGGMVLDSHKKSKTKARYGERMREAGLDRMLYPYAVEFVQ